jgi:murein L,D-transpeptidase YafK
LPYIYLTQGSDGIEKLLDKELTKSSFWQSELKDHDTTFGYFQSTKSVLLCDKSKSKLYLYNKDKNGKFKLRKEYSAFTGKKNGDKSHEGDLKTPVGVYKLEKRLDKVDSFYGPLAFVTSYPNVYDRIRGKTGSGIWIHGLPYNQKRDDYTKGCIAIENSLLECMDKNLNTDQSILLIDEKLNLKPTKDNLSHLLSSLFEWRYDWIYNDFEGYMSFYDSTFTRDDGKNYNVFQRVQKKSIFI